MKVLQCWLLVAPLLLGLGGIPNAYSQITPSGDAYINTALPTTNYGTAVTLGVVSPSQTTFIAFDLSSIPSGYTGSSIAKATLKLYVSTVTKEGSFNVDLVNGSWTESTLNANNAPALGATIAASVPLTKSQARDYVLIDITQALQDWLNGTPNDGIALVANSPFAATFESKENIKESHNAELDVVYAAGNGTITGVNTAAGSGLTGGGTSGTLNLSLLTSCSSKQILQWNGSSWACSNAGTGTITGVTAGTDLTGGGNGGNVTLNLDTTKIPQLAAANAFTNNNAIAVNSSTPGLKVSNGTGDGANFSGGYDAAEFFGGAGGGIYVDTHADADLAAAVYANAWGASMRTVGVDGYSASNSGVGVYGRVSSGSSLTGYGSGVWGDSSSGRGVMGTSDFYDGVVGISGVSVGVLGQSNGPLGSAGVASGGGEGNAIQGYNAPTASPGRANATMWLQNGSSSAEYVLYAENGSGSQSVVTDTSGDLVATGIIVGAVKSFKIDHPLDPTGKYLFHTDIESPDMKNLYDGVTVLDQNGEAWVELPGYFEALNQEFRYQLTAMGVSQPGLYVAEQISGNRFLVAGGKPGGKVSWQVTGIRHDAWANAHRSPVEVEKTETERGRYLHPDAFGFGPEQSVSYHEDKQFPKLHGIGKKSLNEMPRAQLSTTKPKPAH